MTIVKKGIHLSIAGLMLALSMSAHSATRTLDQIAAIVNDDVITRTELDEQVTLISKQLRGQRMATPPMSILRKQVLEREILKRIQLQLARNTGIRVTDSDIGNLVNRIAAQNGMSLRQLQQQIENDGMSFATFRSDLKDQRIIAMLQQREVHSRITITDPEIEAFLATQAVQGDASTQYRVSHILVSIPDSAQPEKVNHLRKKAQDILNQLKAGSDFKELAIRHSDSTQALKDGGDMGWRTTGELPTLFAAEIHKMKKGQVSPILRSPSGFHILKLNGKRTGEQHIIVQTQARHILIKPDELTPESEVITRLQRLRNQIRNGSIEFAHAARTHSDDKGSAVNGGDLGWVTPGIMVPEFETEMNKLKAGEISEPFQSMFGYHIVQVLDRKEVDDSEAYSRAKSRELLRQRKIEENLEAWIRQLRDQAYVEIKNS